MGARGEPRARKRSSTFERPRAVPRAVHGGRSASWIDGSPGAWIKQFARFDRPSPPAAAPPPLPPPLPSRLLAQRHACQSMAEEGQQAGLPSSQQQEQQQQQQQRAQLPMRSETFAAEVGGRRTDFLLTAYSDRLMVVATQLGTLGSMLHAEKETVMGGGTTFRVDTLLGPREQPLAELCARQLAERLAGAGCDRPLLLCLALERAALTPQGVKELIERVMEHPVWVA